MREICTPLLYLSHYKCSKWDGDSQQYLFLLRGTPPLKTTRCFTTPTMSGSKICRPPPAPPPPPPFHAEGNSPVSLHSPSIHPALLLMWTMCWVVWWSIWKVPMAFFCSVLFFWREHEKSDLLNILEGFVKITKKCPYWYFHSFDLRLGAYLDVRYIFFFLSLYWKVESKLLPTETFLLLFFFS